VSKADSPVVAKPSTSCFANPSPFGEAVDRMIRQSVAIWRTGGPDDSPIGRHWANLSTG
jgi:hypothetical protein